ncbi:MAG: ABC transporter substrate-binding protein [Caldilineaceae bacterium]
MFQIDTIITRGWLPTRLAVFAAILSYTILLTGCAPLGTTTAPSSNVEPLVVFGAYGTSVDEPWNQAIHRALLATEAAGDIRYSYVDQIGFTDDIESVLRTAIADNAPDIIIGDAFGNEAAVIAVAQEYPEIAFVFGTDEEPRQPNLSTFDSWNHEAAYLAGMLAGGLTQSNIVGVVAGYPEGSVNRVVNAFTAGAHAVNPDVDVRTTFINSWFDPDAAAATAQTQIAAGADVIFGERTGIIKAAAAAGVYAIGNMIDQRDDAPTAVVSSVVWNLRPTLDYVIEQVRSGRYTAQDLASFGALAAGGAQLAPLNRDVTGGVPDALVAQVEAEEAEIASGSFVVPVDGREPPATTKGIAPIKIGILNPTSGPLASFGQDVNVGIERFFESLGDEINGRPIALIMGDTGGDAEQALAAAQRLVDEEGVDLLMGVVNSSVAGPVAEFANARQAPLVITIAGAAAVTGPARGPYVFRTAMANGQQERPLAAYVATQMGLPRAATIAWDFPAGAERSTAFAKAFIDAGGAIVAELQPPLGTDDFAAYLDALDPAEIDVLYAFLTGPQAADFIHQLRQREGFANLLVVGPGYLTAGVLPQMGADALPMIQASEYTSAIDSPEHDAAIQSLLNDASRTLTSYAEKVRATSDVYVMEGYLGASVVAQALAATEGNVENGERFLQALAAVDFASVSGPFRFDAQGQAIRNLYITQLTAAQNEVQPEIVTIIESVSQ